MTTEAIENYDAVYDLRQMLRKAMNHLRDAEDLTRLNPIWANRDTADRIRSIHEQLTADVLNGKTTIPTLLEQLSDRERELTILWDKLIELGLSNEQINDLISNDC